METPTYEVCSVPIAVVGPERAVEHIVDAARSGAGYQVHLCNAYTLSLVDGDAELRKALEGSDLNLADGVPVAWLGRNMGMTGPVRGAQLVLDVCERGAGYGLRHYLFGGAPGVAEAMAENLRRRIRGVAIVGVEAPPYTYITDAELSEAAGRISRSGANIVWIGLGTPRQDHLVPRLVRRTAVVAVPVGAAFNFLAGEVREAPVRLHGSGFEWLYRLAQEPRRLWRRYTIGNARFIRAAYKHRSSKRLP